MTTKEMFVGGLERMLLCAMPDKMRADIQAVLDRKDSASEYELKSAYHNLSKRLVMSKPRNEIDWNPTVDKDRCIGCGKCFDFCPHKVYQMKDGKSVVTKPLECVILCSNCVKLCPADAISFPDKKDYIDLLKYE